MPGLQRVFRKISDLPVAIPVFPLGGAILFPGAVMPLNVFEPRYLAMVDAALAGRRLIGMIQPAGMSSDGDIPQLADVGCVGKLTGFQETEDGRYLIALTGVCRFRVDEEVRQDTPYRVVRADWKPFSGDLSPSAPTTDVDRARLLAALQSYLQHSGLNADWSAVEDAPIDMLINSLSAGCPFTNPEKQALLESRTLQDRCSALITLLMMERPGQGGGYVQ